MLKRKRKYKSSFRPNNKRLWRAKKRILKTSLSSQPYWVDSAQKAVVAQCIGGGVGLAGFAPIGFWTGTVGTHDIWPYPNTADGTNQYSDLTRIASKIGIFNGTAGTIEDQGQKILINYSKVQYNIRNNTNIALNLRIFQFVPRKDFSGNTNAFANFPTIMDAACTDAGVAATTLNPLSHPTDFPYFNKNFKVVKQKNVRLLPGENIFQSQLTFLNRMMSSAGMNTNTARKRDTKYLGIMFNGDPINDEGSHSYASLSKGHLDIVVTYKLKFRRLDVPTLQNKIHLDNDLANYANQAHTAMFANIANNVGF